MSISVNQLSKFANSDEVLTEAQKRYFRALTRREAYDLVLRRFNELDMDDRALRSRLARRLKKSPSQITRWLSEPSNWTLDTLSDLLLAMGRQTEMSLHDMSVAQRGNYGHPASLAVSRLGLSAPKVSASSSLPDQHSSLVFTGSTSSKPQTGSSPKSASEVRLNLASA